MNRQQKKLVANLITVMVFTITMVVGFANIKNLINRSEAMRAMDIIGNKAFEYRKQYGSLPSEQYMNQFIKNAGIVRLGNFQYRAQWIEFGSNLDTTILAYSERKYRGFIKGGYIVLWLNGKVEWTTKKQFEEILNKQQNKQELQWLKEHLQNQKTL